MRLTTWLLLMTTGFIPSQGWSTGLSESVASRCALQATLEPIAREAARSAEHVSSLALRTLSEQSGLPVPSVRVWVGRGEGSSVVATASAWLHRYVRDLPSARCATAEIDGTTAVVMVPRFVSVTGISARATVGAVSDLHWSLPAGMLSMQLVVDDSEATRVNTVSNAFVFVFTHPGEYTFQLVGETSGGPLPFALWHTTVGASAVTPVVAPPSRAVVAVVSGESSWIGALNAQRRLHGLAWVGRDPFLTRDAAERACVLAEAREVRHALGTSDDVRSRLEQQGVFAERMAENVARGRTLQDAFDGLTQSPNHQRLRLDVGMTSVGLGICSVEQTVYVVELFASRPRLIEPLPR